MILDAVVVGSILAGCVLIAIAGYKKFQPGIEKELQKSQQRDTVQAKTRSRR